MTQGLPLWNACCCTDTSISFSFSYFHLSSISYMRNNGGLKMRTPVVISASAAGETTAKGKRQLRNEKRESRYNNWREEVEERLMNKPKKKNASWTEELNLDNLASMGPQWWIVRVSRTVAQSTADQLARSLARNFPGMDLKVYIPAVHVKRKLKNGSYSDKTNPLFPGCIFLHCILNREIHDFIRECIGVGGFLGYRVGNTKRQINRPKPVSREDMDAIFKQAKQEQKKADLAFEQEQMPERVSDDEELNIGTSLTPQQAATSKRAARPKRQSKKIAESSENNLSEGEEQKQLLLGSNVRILSGPFADFTGYLREVDHSSRKATVELVLFGKQSLVDLDVNQIATELL